MENMDVTLFLNYSLYLDVQFYVDGNQFPTKCSSFQCTVVVPSIDPESDHDIEILLLFDKNKKDVVLTTGIDLQYYHNEVFDQYNNVDPEYIVVNFTIQADDSTPPPIVIPTPTSTTGTAKDRLNPSVPATDSTSTPTKPKPVVKPTNSTGPVIKPAD